MLNDAQLVDLENRIVNWVRWANSNDAGRRRCASAEGRYLAPRADEEKLVREAMPIDHCDAEKIERVVTLLPCDGRTFIVCFYLRRYPRKRILRYLRISELMWDGFRSRTLEQMCQQLHAATPVKLIKRGSLIWAGLAK